MVIISPITATVGFNMTLRDKTPEPALINYNNGDINYSIPQISRTQSPFDKGDVIQYLELVKVKF